MKTPYFIISIEKLNKNIDDFQNALDLIWPNSQMSYSVKTNSLPWLLKYLKKKNVFAEVVSDEEYLLSKKCGYDDNEIIFNGPIKGRSQFLSALKNNAIVNIDSKKDLSYLREYNNKLNHNIGVRINPDPVIFNSEDIGYVDDGFRFGFSESTGELEKAFDIVNKKSESVGLHLHCNSITRSKNVYIELAKYAARIIKKYNLKVSYIDMGGGFFGGIPGKTTPNEYIGAIKEQLEKVVDISKTKLYIEPGSAIIGSVVDLVTTVIDTKDTAKSRIITTDGSRVHVDPLWKKNSYMYSIKSDNKKKSNKQIICGYTCMDHDRIMNLENNTELTVGDKIIYHRVGAYTMTFGGMFIRYYPDVYINYSNKIKKVRSKINVETYYDIQS